MALQQHVTTRELLRNFRGLKDLLLQGKVQHLVVEVGGDRQLELSVRRGSNAAKDIAHLFRGSAGRCGSSEAACSMRCSSRAFPAPEGPAARHERRHLPRPPG